MIGGEKLRHSLSYNKKLPQRKCLMWLNYIKNNFVSLLLVATNKPASQGQTKGNNYMVIQITANSNKT